jgi:hypothetical protein
MCHRLCARERDDEKPLLLTNFLTGIKEGQTGPEKRRNKNQDIFIFYELNVLSDKLVASH